MKKVTIPKPCPFLWDEMTTLPNHQERHCNACNKAVVDFTTRSTNEIISYLETNHSRSVCGRVNTIDLMTNTWKQKISLRLFNYFSNSTNATSFRKLGLFVTGLLVTLSGCQTRTTGEISAIDSTNNSTEIYHSNIPIDTAATIPVDTTNKW